MNRRKTFSERLYSCLVGLYPAEFRHQFGAELLAVFIAKLAEARQSGLYCVFRVWFCELCELPENVFIEYWLAFSNHNKKGKYPMQSLQRVKWLRLLLPPGIVILLTAMNTAWMISLFSNILGWLIVCNFMLILGLNGFMASRPSVPTPWQTGVAGLLTLGALAAVLLGPALIRLSTFLTADVLLVSSLFLGILILADLGLLAGIVSEIKKPHLVTP